MRLGSGGVTRSLESCASDGPGGDEQRAGKRFREATGAVHGLGVGRGVPISPNFSGVRESAGQRVVDAGWLARTRDGSSFWRLLPAALDEFAAPDLVGGDGGEPHFARDAGARDGCDPSHCEIGAAYSGGLDAVQCGECTAWEEHAADQLYEDGRGNRIGDGPNFGK